MGWKRSDKWRRARRTYTDSLQGDPRFSKIWSVFLFMYCWVTQMYQHIYHVLSISRHCQKFKQICNFTTLVSRRRVSSVVEHLSTEPKVPCSSLTRVMDYDISYILLLDWSTTSQRLWQYRISVPYAQNNPRILFKKSRGQPQEILVSCLNNR